MNRFSAAKTQVLNSLNLLFVTNNKKKYFQEMRNAFSLFDRDGDGTINAKVGLSQIVN